MRGWEPTPVRKPWWEETVNSWILSIVGFLWRKNIEEDSPLTAPEELFVDALRLFLRLLPFIVLTIVTLSFPIALEKSWSMAKLKLQSSYLGQSIGLVVLVGVAFILYHVKIRALTSFGGMELWVGGVTCWLGLAERVKGDLAATLALIGGITMLMRGFENVSKGFKPLLIDIRKVWRSSARKPKDTKPRKPWKAGLEPILDPTREILQVPPEPAIDLMLETGKEQKPIVEELLLLRQRLTENPNYLKDMLTENPNYLKDMLRENPNFVKLLELQRALDPDCIKRDREKTENLLKLCENLRFP